MFIKPTETLKMQNVSLILYTIYICYIFIYIYKISRSVLVLFSFCSLFCFAPEFCLLVSFYGLDYVQLLSLQKFFLRNLCSPRLYLFDQKYSKTILKIIYVRDKTVKYYYNFK